MSDEAIDVELNGTSTNDQSGLLASRFDTTPTSSRLLQGLMDVLMLVLVFLPFLVIRITRYVLSWIGVTEHRQDCTCC